MFVTFSALTSQSNYIWYFHRAYLYIFISLFIYVVLSVFIAVIMDNYENLKVIFFLYLRSVNSSKIAVEACKLFNLIGEVL